jgi:hypothetical protein
MFVVNNTGADILIHEINARVPSGDKLYKLPSYLKENYTQLTIIPDSIVKKLDDRAIALELAEKRIEELEKILDIYNKHSAHECCGKCVTDNLDVSEPMEREQLPIETREPIQPTKKGRGRPPRKLIYK